MSSVLHACLLVAVYSVVAARPRIEPLAPASFRGACGPEVEACTRVTGVSVACRCREAAPDAWQLDVRASFIPQLIFQRPTARLMRHELRHIDDIHAAVTDYVAALAGRRFASANDCERARTRVEQTFVSTVRAFADESQRQRR